MKIFPGHALTMGRHVGRLKQSRTFTALLRRRVPNYQYHGANAGREQLGILHLRRLISPRCRAIRGGAQKAMPTAGGARRSERKRSRKSNDGPDESDGSENPPKIWRARRLFFSLS